MSFARSMSLALVPLHQVLPCMSRDGVDTRASSRRTTRTTHHFLEREVD